MGKIAIEQKISCWWTSWNRISFGTANTWCALCFSSKQWKHFYTPQIFVIIPTMKTAACLSFPTQLFLHPEVSKKKKKLVLGLLSFSLLLFCLCLLSICTTTCLSEQLPSPSWFSKLRKTACLLHQEGQIAPTGGDKLNASHFRTAELHGEQLGTKPYQHIVLTTLSQLSHQQECPGTEKRTVCPTHHTSHICFLTLE